jgi:hypothetical protein
MDDQQQHLKACVDQQADLLKDMQTLQTQLTEKRELALKLQGIIEYLTSNGVTLPEAPAEQPQEEVPAEAAKEDE